MINRYNISVYFLPVLVVFAYLFLYVPIILLILFSFNNDQFAYSWVGFTTKWYGQLFASTEVWSALKNSLIVASTSVILSVSIGTILVCYGARRSVSRLMFTFYAGLAIPEIVLAVGLISFFSFFSITLGLSSLVVAHTLIGLGYVVPIIYARYNDLDKRLIEAAYDLGATRSQAFRTVILPLLSPALIACALLVFIVSFDDFLLSFFCSSASAQTLPIYIFSLIRLGASPEINALSTLLLLISSLVMGIFFWVQVKKMDTL